MKEEIRICMMTPGLNNAWGIPALVWGSPGIGKSSQVASLAEELGLPLEVVILSVREPSDVVGLPVIKDGSVQIELPIWAKNLINAGRGILFFDELNTAPPAVQSAALRIIMDRVVGDVKLPDEVRIIAATNPPDESAGGWDLPPPLANRFIHLNYSGPSAGQWCDWLLGNKEVLYNNPINIESWNSMFAKFKGLVSSYIMKNPTALGPDVPKDPSLASKGWPSPRSWEMTTRIMATGALLNQDCFNLIEGAIGRGAAVELKHFEAYADLPDPVDLINGKVQLQHDEKRLDRTMAALSSIASFAVSYPDTSPKVWGVINKISKKCRDVAVPAMRLLVSNRLFHSNEALEFLSNIDDTLAAAIGINGKI